MAQPDYIPPPIHAKINQFATRCFRDTGDADYISARLAIRAHLPGPFLWSAQQAIEKYLKCILMLNRVNTGDLSHDIELALNRLNEKLPFQISLPEDEREIFDHIARYNGDRYLIASMEVHAIEVIQLDRLVWRLRQYCRPLDLNHYADTPSEKVLLERVSVVEAGLDGPQKNGHMPGGVLENILENKAHPAHEALVWQNLKFSLSNRKRLRFAPYFQAINAPLWLAPELADEVAKWMKIPRAVLHHAREMALENAKEKQKSGE